MEKHENPHTLYRIICNILYKCKCFFFLLHELSLKPSQNYQDLFSYFQLCIICKVLSDPPVGMST